MRVYLVDDERLALNRLTRLLIATGRVDIAGASTDPIEAAQTIAESKPDVLFLDIEMPGMNGFEMLGKLNPQPLVVFTTAYDRYAIRAFEVNSVGYLLKPVDPTHLERALSKIESIRGGREPAPLIAELLKQLAETPARNRPEYLERIASRTGERFEFIPVSRITHFFAGGKLTHAATAAKNHVIDSTIDELESKLNPKKFVRIHRSAILNLDYLHELHTWFGGGMVARLKGDKPMELKVARDRVRDLKARLGI